MWSFARKHYRASLTLIFSRVGLASKANHNISKVSVCLKTVKVTCGFWVNIVLNKHFCLLAIPNYLSRKWRKVSLPETKLFIPQPVLSKTRKDYRKVIQNPFLILGWKRFFIFKLTNKDKFGQVRVFIHVYIFAVVSRKS